MSWDVAHWPAARRIYARAVRRSTVPSPNFPPGFDLTDPDIYAERLPVEEFAELRATAPIWWNAQAPGKGGGFHDGGYWAITKHKDVKEISRRNDVFSSCGELHDPAVQRRHRARGHRPAAGGAAEHGPAAAHPAAADHLPRVHAARHRAHPRRTERTRPEHRQGRGGHRLGRLRRAGGLRAAPAGDRRSARRAAGGPRQALPLVERDDRQRRPRVRRRRRQDVVDGGAHVRHADGRDARPRTPARTSSPP